MNNSGKQNYDKFRRVVAFVFGVGVLLTSLYFSKAGFSFKVENEDIWWVGWVIAGAVSAAQFMFNTERKELDWTIVLVGLTAYIYSIWSNIQGWESLRGVQDYMNWAGGIFMDVFPEKAIAWSLGAIKVGDFVGNIWSVLKNPEKLDEQVSASTGGKRVTDREAHIRNLQRASEQYRRETTKNGSSSENQNYHTPMRVKEQSGKKQPNRPESSYKGEPTYHPMGQPYQEPEGDIPPFMKQIIKDADRAVRG